MPATDRRILHIIAVYGLLLLLLYSTVDRLPLAWGAFWYPEKLIGPDGRLPAMEWLWGIYPYTYLPAWLGWIAAGLTAIAVIWLGFSRREKIMIPAFPRSGKLQVLLAIMAFPLFYAGRVVHTRWGDAFLLVEGMAHPQTRLTYNWQAPLDIFVHARLFQAGESMFGWRNALPSYWILSSLAGAFAIWVLLKLATDLGRGDGERWAIFGVMATLGAVQLFFGYPENYTIISLLVLVYFWLGWRFLQGKSSLWAPSLVLALALGFHPITLVLQPSLWVLAWVYWKRGQSTRGRTSFWGMMPALLIPPLIVLLLTIVLMSVGGRGLDVFLSVEAPGGGDRRWLVPLTRIESQWQYYTMFSRAHLLDIVNQQLLVAPFTLPLLFILIVGYRRQLSIDPYSYFLIAAAGCFLLLTWIWNPDYGGQRDWDLFAPAAWPSTLLAVYWLTRTVQSLAMFRIALIVVLVQGLHTMAWIYSNTRPWEWS